MAKSAYHEIGGPGGLLNRLARFEGNSMRAYWSSDGTYRVLSYSTLIAIYDPSVRTLYLNEAPYSPTTARHQHLVRSWLGYSPVIGHPTTVVFDGPQALQRYFDREQAEYLERQPLRQYAHA